MKTAGGTAGPPGEAGAARWTVIQTRSRHEKAVEETLTRLGLRAYLPLREETRRWSDRVRRVSFPLFPGYVFLFCEEPLRQRVFAVQGIVGFVSASGAPLEIPETEIDAIRDTLASGVPYLPHPDLKPGQRVSVVRGPLRGVAGRLIKHGRKHRLVLAIWSLGQAISVEIEAADVVPS